MNRATVLIVDDNERNRLILNDYIETLDHIPVLIETGRKALDYLADHPVDIVLLDILMPEMNGYEVLEHMKASPALIHIPVIVISAIDELDSVVRCIEKGADDYLVKPFNPAILKARLKSCLDRKELHDALETSYRNLKQAEQSRDALFHMIVHDLKNPLSVIRMHAELIPFLSNEESEAYGDGSDAANSIEKIIASVDAMTDQIGRILDVARLEAGEIPIQSESFNAAKLLCNVCDMFTTQSDKRFVSFSCDRPDEPIMVVADRHLLSRMLQNIISNAIKYAGQEPRVLCSIARNSSLVDICISDNGPGIPTEFQEKIFEKFYQINPEKKSFGAGLGLAFCKMAAIAQNGSVSVRNAPDGGAVFHISLPAPTDC